MATQQSIDHLVGLAVAMLGVAPGTDWLNARAKQLDGGATLADIANEIQSSSAFEDKYPAFLTNERFAKDFLEALLGDHVDDAVMMAAVDFVAGQLAGASRGELALALVDALTIIGGEGGSEADMAFRELHSGNFGKAAAAFHNKVMVAKHYTEEARMEDPSSSVLEGVTDAAESVTAAINNIDNPPVPAEPMEGRTIELTRGIDRIAPGDGDGDTTPYDDIIVARPVTQVGTRAAEVLNPSDTIDGGGGDDTIYVYGVERDSETRLVRERITNVENLVIDTVGGIDADLTRWEGLKSVQLDFFGDDQNVTVTVDDGATISSLEEFGGAEATLVGASGAVDIEASGNTAVHIGSAGETESVMVKGGASVTVDNGASSGNKQSATVTHVSVDGVAEKLGDTVNRPSGTFVPMTDRDGFVVGDDGSTRITISPATGETFTLVRYVDGAFVNGALAAVNSIDPGDPITVTIPSWNHDGDTGDDASAELTSVIVELAFDGRADGGGIVFGDIMSIDSNAPDAEAFPDDVDVDDLNGMPLSSQELGVVTSRSIGRKDAGEERVRVDGEATLKIFSDSIETVHLHNTDAIAEVTNNSKMPDGKPKPEDLAVTVDGFGSFNPNGTSKEEGRLDVKGAGSAEDVKITAQGASNFRLTSDKVKNLEIDAGEKLRLKVHKLDDETPSSTLESVKISGTGGVMMPNLEGMNKLKMIDAGDSSGENHFKSSDNDDADIDAELDSLTMVKGGSGKDTVELATSLRGKLASIDTGEGDDTVKISDDYRDEGLMVKLGAGDDEFHGNAGNGESRIDGGDGRDKLRLSADGATYEDGDDTVSIYANFEILDVGGGANTYNVGRLGVDTIEVNKDTEATVELENVGGGTSLSVSAEKAGTGTTADISYEFADDVNVGGSLIDGGTSNVLNVSLMAKGKNTDTKTTQTGLAKLDIELDGDLRAMSVESDASVHNTAKGKGVNEGHYQNEVTVTGDSALEEVRITGGAYTKLSGAGLDDLEFVNAAGSGGGVNIDASASDEELTLVGSQQDDVLKAGTFTATTTDRNTLRGNGGDDELTAGANGSALVGGAGADTLTAGGGVDLFVFTAAADSRVSFKRDPVDNEIKAEGYDTIEDFATTTDKIVLSKALWAIVSAGSFKGTGEWGATAGVTAGWSPTDTDGPGSGTATTPTTSIDGNPNRFVPPGTNADGGATDLRDFIGNGKGLFLTTIANTEAISGTRQVKNSVAVIDDNTTGSEGLWVLFDIDANGDFDDGTDMVIFLEGAATAFVQGDMMSA